MPATKASRHHGYTDQQVESFLRMRARGAHVREISVAMGATKYAGDYGTAHQRWDNLWRRHQRWFTEILLEQVKKEFGAQPWHESARLIDGPLRRIPKSEKWYETWILQITIRASEENAARALGAAYESDGWHWRSIVVVFNQPISIVDATKGQKISFVLD